MRKLVVFENVSLDGYYVDAQGSMEWAKRDSDREYEAFASKNAGGDGILVFGRTTYELMAGFWSTPLAAKLLPKVAAGMNARPKIVFSRRLKRADWGGTALVRGDAVAKLRNLKKKPGPDLVVLGSGSLVAALAKAGLVDEVQLMVVPVALGKGRTLFEGLSKPLDFSLTQSKTFKSGKVFLRYVPQKTVR